MGGVREVLRSPDSFQDLNSNGVSMKSWFFGDLTLSLPDYNPQMQEHENKYFLAIKLNHTQNSYKR